MNKAMTTLATVRAVSSKELWDTDLVDRLRAQYFELGVSPDEAEDLLALRWEAAERIERLKTENLQLRATLDAFTQSTEKMSKLLDLDRAKLSEGS